MSYSNFRPAQSNLLRQLNRKNFNESRLGRKWSSARQATKTLGSAASQLAYKFGTRSTIHGMNRLLSPSTDRYEKLIWFLTVVLAFIGSIYVCLILSDRFSDGKFETIVDNTREPVYSIYFPVVTICNQNRLNWARIEQAKKRFIPDEKSSEKLLLFERIVGAYDDVAFANFDSFQVLENEPLQQLNFVNFSQVVDMMSWRCEEFLTNCVWNHEPMNCCEIFSRRKTKRGYCWAFNTLESDEGRRMQLRDALWPWHTAGAGPTSGLNVRVHIHPEKHYPKRKNDKGIDVMITEPNVWHKDPYIIAEKTQTIVEIEPVIYFYDNDTRSVSSDQRQCVFDDERFSSDFKSLQGFIYMIENCQSECHQEYLMRYCNCSMDLLFPPGKYVSSSGFCTTYSHFTARPLISKMISNYYAGPYPACKASDLLCLAKNNAYFLYSHQPGEEAFVRTQHEGMICKCFRNCYSLNYVNDVRPAFLAPEVIGNDSYVDLDVHYRFDTMMVYRTRLVFGWLDLLVAFGGIAGLFLGCSLISAIELAYFAFIELPHFFYRELRGNIRTTPHTTPQTVKERIRAWPQSQFGDYESTNNYSYSTITAPKRTQYHQQQFARVAAGGAGSTWTQHILAAQGTKRYH